MKFFKLVVNFYYSYKPKSKYKAHLTILCYGGTLIDVENSLVEIFQELEILTKIICLVAFLQYII